MVFVNRQMALKTHFPNIAVTAKCDADVPTCAAGARNQNTFRRIMFIYSTMADYLLARSVYIRIDGEAAVGTL